jgi:hypothetical protein
VPGPAGPTGEVHVVELTQAEYDALPSIAPNTLYVITDAPAGGGGSSGPFSGIHTQHFIGVVNPAGPAAGPPIGKPFYENMPRYMADNAGSFTQRQLYAVAVWLEAGQPIKELVLLANSSYFGNMGWAALYKASSDATATPDLTLVGVQSDTTTGIAVPGNGGFATFPWATPVVTATDGLHYIAWVLGDTGAHSLKGRSHVVSNTNYPPVLAGAISGQSALLGVAPPSLTAVTFAFTAPTVYPYIALTQPR